MQVLVVNWRGESRAVAIGRLKVETRPMIMVEFQGEATRLSRASKASIGPLTLLGHMCININILVIGIKYTGIISAVL